MSALYFREPTEEEKLEAGIEEPFTVLEHSETDTKEIKQAFDGMFEDGMIAFNDFIASWRTCK